MKLRRKLSYERKKQFMGWVFVAPWIVGLLYFFLIPVCYSIINSFCRLDFTPGNMEFSFVGLDYYKQALFSNQYTIPTLVDSIVELIYQVPLIIIFSLFSLITIPRPKSFRS